MGSAIDHPHVSLNSICEIRYDDSGEQYLMLNSYTGSCAEKNTHSEKNSKCSNMLDVQGFNAIPMRAVLVPPL